MNDDQIQRLAGLIAKGSEVLATHGHSDNFTVFTALNRGAFTGGKLSR